MSENYTPAERVAAGVALLDARVPDWRTRVDVESLDLSVGDLCIMGQVFGNDYDDERRSFRLPYTYGLRCLDLDYDGGRAHGFDFVESSREYPELKAAWVSAIG